MNVTPSMKDALSLVAGCVGSSMSLDQILKSDEGKKNQREVRAAFQVYKFRKSWDAAFEEVDAFQALTQPPAKTVPVESLVPPSDEAEVIEEDDEPLEEEPPLSEEDAIRLVTQWAEEDGALPADKRESEEEIFERLKEGPCTVSDSRLKEIVSKYWAGSETPSAQTQMGTSVKANDTSHPYPPKLEPLIKSGVAFQDEYGHWVGNRCTECGQFGKNKCCGSILPVELVRFDGQALTHYGGQALGLCPIVPPKSREQILQDKITSLKNEPCWNQFRGVGELEGNGTVKMYVENFLPEGVTLICGLAKEGKSFLALAIAKALTTGKPLLGRRGFEVPEITPVLYLAAESGDRGLKLRCEKFGITKDKTKFICRTLTQGLMFGLDDPNIEAIVKTMRPVVVLETLIRFNDGKDEDDASESKKLAEGIFRLIALGARAVVAIHHSRKDVKSNPTKEAAARGSGDVLAMADAVWLLMQDEKLFQGGKGPNELDVIGWGRDFNPVPMRLALTKTAPKGLPPGTITYAPGIVSLIDTTHDFGWVSKLAQETKRLEFGQELERLIAKNPSLSLEDLSRKTERSEWEVRKAVKKMGYRRARGGKPGESAWTKAA